MATVKVWWHRDGEAPIPPVKLVQGARLWADALNITGVWDSDANAYYFELDTTNSDKYDPTELYKIMENTVEIVSAIELGAYNTSTGLATHIADNTAHSATGDVVGRTKAQTLTNKTISDDDNVVTNLDLSTAVKANTNSVAIGIKPGADDSVIHIKDSNVAAIQLEASNAARNADRALLIRAGYIDLDNQAAGDIKITGLAEPTAANGAVPKSITDALDTRVTALERADAFAGTPICRIALAAPRFQNWVLEMSFQMDSQLNEDAVRRYEIFWATSDFEWVNGGAAGVIIAADLAALRIRCQGTMRVDGGTGNRVTLQANQRLYAIAVAFDWDTPINQYVSIDATAQPNTQGVRREQTGEVIHGSDGAQSAYFSNAGFATGNTITAVGEWTQVGDATIAKHSRGYEHDSNNKTLRISFFAKSGDTGSIGEDMLVTVEIKDPAGTVVKTGYFNVDDTTYFAYPSAPQSIDIDVSTGLVAGTTYTVLISQHNVVADNSYTSKIKENISVKPISDIPIY